MNIIQIEPSAMSIPNQDFVAHFNADLELCEFSEDTKLGLLFFIGAALPSYLINCFGTEIDKVKEKMNILSLYSKSTGDFDDYGALNDYVFHHWIYNANLAIQNGLKEEGIVDDNLRKIKYKGKDVTVCGKSEPEIEFLEIFANEDFSLNWAQNLMDRVFEEFGKELLKKQINLQQSFEAGYAYYMLMTKTDVKGINYLINKIISVLPPIYQSLLHSSVLFNENLEAFYSNHIFSKILNTLYGGENSSLINLAKPIHTYHQDIFYQNKSLEIRSEWPFAKNTDEGSAMLIFINAIGIRKTSLVLNKSIYSKSKEIYNKKLINTSCTLNHFLVCILNIVYEKYGIDGKDEFTNETKTWKTGWNNKGEYLQFLAILFYETCLHAIVVKGFIDERK